MNSGEWDMRILDEILYTIGYGLLHAEEVATALAARPPLLHVTLTGRNAHPKLFELADTVTEMHERKHAYQKVSRPSYASNTKFDQAMTPAA